MMPLLDFRFILVLVLFATWAFIGGPDGCDRDTSEPPSIAAKIHRECEAKREGMTAEGWNACLVSECQEWGGSWQDGECLLGIGEQ